MRKQPKTGIDIDSYSGDLHRTRWTSFACVHFARCTFLLSFYL